MAIDSTDIKTYLKQFVDAYTIGYEIPRVMESLKEEIEAIGEKKYSLKPNTFNYARTLRDQLISCFRHEWKDKQKKPDKFIIIDRKKIVDHFALLFVPRSAWNIDFKTWYFSDSFKKLKLLDQDCIVQKKSSLFTDLYEIRFPANYHNQLQRIYNEAVLATEKIKAEYPQQIEDFNKEQMIKQQNNILKKQLLEQEFSSLNEKRIKVNSIICSFRDGFPKQYRSFTCVSFLYDCISTGRCIELTGPFGAFQRYEEEKKFGRIVDSLTGIEGKLDQIISNQNALANIIVDCASQIEQTIKSIDANIQDLLSKSEAIQNTLNPEMRNSIVLEHKNHLATISYNVEKIATLEAYVNRIKLYKGEFTGFQSNYPSYK